MMNKNVRLSVSLLSNSKCFGMNVLRDLPLNHRVLVSFSSHNSHHTSLLILTFSIYLSIYLSVCLSLYFSIFLSFSLLLSVRFSLSFSLPVTSLRSLSLSLSLSLSFSVSPSSLSLSLSLPFYLSLSGSTYWVQRVLSDRWHQMQPEQQHVSVHLMSFTCPVCSWVQRYRGQGTCPEYISLYPMLTYGNSFKLAMSRLLYIKDGPL